MIPTVGVTRYVTPLREGGSLPGLVEADDLGTYVCKFRGAGQGVRVLVAEVVVGGLAERLGLRTPRMVALDLDPEIARYEADEEVQDLLNASPGLNLGDGLPARRVRVRRGDARGLRPGAGPLARRVHGQRRPDLAQPQPAALARRPVGHRPRGVPLLPPRLARWRRRSRRVRRPDLVARRPRLPRPCRRAGPGRRRGARPAGRRRVRRGAGRGAGLLARAGAGCRLPGRRARGVRRRSWPRDSSPVSGCRRWWHDHRRAAQLRVRRAALRAPGGPRGVPQRRRGPALPGRRLPARGLARRPGAAARAGRAASTWTRCARR